MDLKELFTKEFSQKPVGITTDDHAQFLNALIEAGPEAYATTREALKTAAGVKNGIIKFLNALIEAGPEAYDTIRKALKTAEGVSVLSEITRIAKEGHVKAINLLKLLEEKGLAERVYEKYLIAKAKEGLVSTASLGKTLLSKKELAGRLLDLPPATRAMVIAGSYEELLKSVPREHIDDERERVARRMEEILDEMPDREAKATQRALKTVGEDILKNMIRGNAGGVSSVVIQEMVTPEMLEELFLEDPEIKKLTDPESGPRILRLLWTIAMEGPEEFPALEKFLRCDTGRDVIREVIKLANEGDENASELARKLEERNALFVAHEDEERTEFLFSDDEEVGQDEEEVGQDEEEVGQDEEEVGQDEDKEEDED